MVRQLLTTDAAPKEPCPDARQLKGEAGDWSNHIELCPTYLNQQFKGKTPLDIASMREMELDVRIQASLARERAHLIDMRDSYKAVVSALKKNGARLSKELHA